jgi:hypothetical protein
MPIIEVEVESSVSIKQLKRQMFAENGYVEHDKLFKLYIANCAIDIEYTNIKLSNDEYCQMIGPKISDELREHLTFTFENYGYNVDHVFVESTPWGYGAVCRFRNVLLSFTVGDRQLNFVFFEMQRDDEGSIIRPVCVKLCDFDISNLFEFCEWQLWNDITHIKRFLEGFSSKFNIKFESFGFDFEIDWYNRDMQSKIVAYEYHDPEFSRMVLDIFKETVFASNMNAVAP